MMVCWSWCESLVRGSCEAINCSPIPPGTFILPPSLLVIYSLFAQRVTAKLHRRRKKKHSNLHRIPHSDGFKRILRWPTSVPSSGRSWIPTAGLSSSRSSTTGDGLPAGSPSCAGEEEWRRWLLRWHIGRTMLLLRLRRLLRLFGMSLLGGFHGVLFYCYNCSVSFGFNCQSLCSAHQDEEIVTLLFLYFFPLFLCFFPSQARANLTALGNANFPSRFSACHLFGVSRVGMVMGWVCVSSCQ